MMKAQMTIVEGLSCFDNAEHSTNTRRKMMENAWTIVFLAGLACPSCSFRSLDYLTNGARRLDASEDVGEDRDLGSPGVADAARAPDLRSPDAGGDVVAASDDASFPDLGRDLACDPGSAISDLAPRVDREASDETAGSAGGDAPGPAGDLAAESPPDSGTAADSAGAGMVYGVARQSCGAGLACPGGSSCCAQIMVPAGNYVMGTTSDPGRGDDEQPEHAALMGAFWLDQYEVTVGRFRAFVRAFDGTLPPPSSGAVSGTPGSGWLPDYDQHLPASKTALVDQVSCSALYQTWTTAAGVRETMPVNCVDWYVALAFCTWDGGRLPTEAEWEVSASNGSDHTRFPWGSADPDPAKHAVMDCIADGTKGCAPSDLLPVGSRPAGASYLGHLDLAGSLYEWTMDYYDPTYYSSIGTCDDCVDVEASSTRVLRGGDFTSPATLVRAAKRADAEPNQINPYAGFRCAREP
jgi:sulfatase modifying factor 1